MIHEPGDANREVNVTETFHLQTDDELSDKELKQIEADDQAIQTIFLGLPKDIYAVVDSYETAQEIWLRVQHMMKGFDIGIQEKKAKLFNEWERFTSNEGESFESCYHYFLKLMNDLKRNKHFHEKIASMNIGQDRQMQIVGGNGGNQFRQYAGQNAGNLAGYNDVIGNQLAKWKPDKVLQLQESRSLCLELHRQAKEKGCCLSTDIVIACLEGRGRNPTLNRRQASTSGTQTDSAPVYDTDGSDEVHENCDDNEILNMFTQEEQYTELLKPIPESHQVPQNDNDVIFEDTSVEQGGEIVEQHPANFEETHALYESLYQTLAIEVEKVNPVNRKLKETNANMTTELARYKNQERCFEISQEKYDKLERCYQQSIYQEQCLSKKINALHLSSGKQIMTLNEQISELNKQLSKEKSTFSFLLEEKKKLKSDFKTYKDERLDKQIQLEKKIKEFNNILLKT
nr:hypothetical protein [Tanacetum cinerariifolium]